MPIEQTFQVQPSKAVKGAIDNLSQKSENIMHEVARSIVPSNSYSPNERSHSNIKGELYKWVGEKRLLVVLVCGASTVSSKGCINAACGWYASSSG